MLNGKSPATYRSAAWRALVRKATRSRALRFTATGFLALLTVWFVAQLREDGSQARPSQLPGGSETGWLREAPAGTAVTPEIRLDEMAEGARFDRRSAGSVAATLAGNREPIDTMPVGRFLDAVPHLRLSYGEMSIVLERESLTRIAQSLAGDVPVENVSVGALLDNIPYLRVRTLMRRRWLAGRLQDALAETRNDGPLATALKEVIGDVAPVQLAHDARFDERRTMQLQYAAIVRNVKDIQRAGGTGVGPDGVYDQAFYHLVSQDRVEAVPLLDGYRRLQQEMASDRLDTLNRSERIAYRWEARRRAFGPDVASLLFSREEAMERYEIDRLAIDADPGLTAEERAGRISDRRDALKAELAAQGTYVSFPAERGGAVRQP